ncbi:BCD family MFS transporter [Aurantimonas sp. HBX-1]|uniref:BCD family MFS transporter n=1 Tax=Aurantimonas sp. HBX-1 TaxID=2906072 RepID=UPI001F30F752|nr:BCD family MFS transporter [Aurantimonas sp. HBX-1]UIJ73243.1 BCD family MFS transporter [Aurantimonas sp. HBX-1]
MPAGLSWLQIVRLALVQTALGAMVVLTTATMNRVMVVELALPAMLPGALVALHYAVQMLRPRFGHGADGGRRRTPWIIGGMAVLAVGTVGAATATALMSVSPAAGAIAAAFAFLLIGAGVGAAGTNLLTLVATSVAPARRAPAATLIWIMMIAGFAVTTGLAGSFLDPYSSLRLVVVTAVVAATAMLLAVVAVRGIEPARPARAPEPQVRPDFRTAFAEVWQERQTRRFTIFVFISMLAYSAQDLVLEPFAGLVFAMTPGETTQLSSVQHGGVVVGMVLVALAGAWLSRRFPGLLRGFCVLGCVGSAASLAMLAAGSAAPGGLALRETVFALGVCNGVFAVAAIGSMMALAGNGRNAREGVRMGLWGAAQAIAFGAGGFAGTALVDAAAALVGRADAAYGIVFGLEAALFLVSAALALGAIAVPGTSTVTPRSGSRNDRAVPA